ncbi:hypothetical protein K438DRAFT_1810615 [Mycena galopus ATCC 62051]|nr:hypothetical protein K438DRAFT_1810615 [Mycena galopus ATCC 62051]
MQELIPSHPTELHLPRELEREIFEIAALTDWKTILTLVRVAARVKEWVEPLLYRVIVVSSASGHEYRAKSRHVYRGKSLSFPIFTVDILLRIIATKSPEFLQGSVRYIHFNVTTDATVRETICRACNRVENLFLQCFHPRLVDAVGGLRHLRRLKIWVMELVECSTFKSTRRMLRNLTHLELIGISAFPNHTKKVSACLPLMPRLTHISFTPISRHPSLHAALHAAKNLRCILFSVLTNDFDNELQTGDALLSDARFLCLRREKFDENWLHGSDTAKDHWTLAEAFLRARREGKVARSVFMISTTDTSWNQAVSTPS